MKVAFQRNFEDGWERQTIKRLGYDKKHREYKCITVNLIQSMGCNEKHENP